MFTLTTHSPEETESLGRSLGAALGGGEVILLRGGLGAGKTCFASGVAAGLGIEEPAVSPTYIIQRSYAGAKGITLHHMDFYRLNSSRDADALGLEESADENSVTLVEWPERCPGVFTDYSLEIEFMTPNVNDAPDTRTLEMRLGPRPGCSPSWLNGIESIKK